MESNDVLRTAVEAIAPIDETAAEGARQRWASRAKPPGSLGRIEDIAVQVAAITGAVPPSPIARPAIAVFAGDHGVVADGASAWPKEVTALMVGNMAEGKAAINAFAASVRAEVRLVDVGVDADLGAIEGVVAAKVRRGTASIARGPAMTRDEAIAALEIGVDTATDLVRSGADLLAGGEMGIGNTTPSAALVAIFANAEAAAVTGPGAGLPADRLGHKQTIIDAAVERARRLGDPIDILAEVGGLEIAALAGFMIGAAAAKVPVVIDGVIAAAALCAADAIAPGVASRTIAGHRSTEPAATVALDHLKLDPILDLDLRLGEGTGACLAIPIIQAAVNALATMGDLPV